MHTDQSKPYVAHETDNKNIGTPHQAFDGGQVQQLAAQPPAAKKNYCMKSEQREHC